MSSDLSEGTDWFVWAPILQGHVTLGELKRDYTLDDLCDLHFAMFDFEELKDNGDGN